MSEAVSDSKIEAINQFFSAYAANDVTAMSAVLGPDIEGTIPGHQHDVELPQSYRDFLTNMGGSGAAPYYD